MKRIAIVIAALSLVACATHNVKLADGSTTILRGADAEYFNKLQDPLVRQSFDTKGKAPKVFMNMVTPECEGNVAVTYFPDRLYWILRGTPSFAGKDDKELAVEQINTCRRAHEAGKK